MKRINKILVALDLSTYSRSILQCSLNLANERSAELVLVNVINSRSIDAAKNAFNAEHPGCFSMEKYVGDDMDRRRRQLVQLLSDCKADPDSVRIVIRTGVPVEAILEILDGEEFDLLVMGPKGRTNLPGFLFGTTAEKLFRHSPVPVFSVRE